MYLIVLVAVVYLGDYLVLRARMMRGSHAAFGSVTVQSYYVVGLKNGRTEYDYGGAQDVTCVKSLLPHMGDNPCWYQTRHTERQIKIDSGNPNNPHIF